MTSGRILWKTKYDRSDNKASALAKALGIPEVIAILLCNRGYGEAKAAKDFLSNAYSFNDPFGLPDMDRATDVIISAIKGDKIIAVYGDYDVDGITSTSALFLYLQSKGANVIYHIPSRSTEGYGMNAAAIDNLHKKGCKLIITVDTGITAVNEVEYAKSLGIDVVVTDHHEVHGDIPDAPVINPKRPDCTYGFCDFAGVGVVFKLLCALEKKIKNIPLELASANIVEKYADLCALGTIADVMPLVSENRLLVYLGLGIMSEKPRPGIETLLSASTNFNNKKAKITTSTVGFVIAPKLNAAGRLADASIAVSLLLAKTESEAGRYALELVNMNKERQRTENEIFKEAVSMIESEFDFENDGIIVLAKKGWHQGVIGIVSSRITEKYSLPSILVSFDDDGIGKGSGRSVKGLNLAYALSNCSDCLLKFGGHELAAGMSVSEDKFKEFKEKINSFVKQHSGEDEERSSLVADCELFADEISMENVKLLDMLEPYGTANPSPLFIIRDVIVRDISGVGEDKHSKFVFEKEGKLFSGILFGASPSSLTVTTRNRADILFSLSINEFRGVSNVQLLVNKIRISDAEYNDRKKQIELYNALKRGEYPECSRITPRHSEFAIVYRAIGRLSEKSFARLNVSYFAGLLKDDRENAYVRVKFILDILSEMQLLSFTYDENNEDIFTAKIIPVRGKTNLDKSEIYKSLKLRNKKYGRKV